MSSDSSLIRSLAFSATQDSQSKPNMSFVWNVSLQTAGDNKGSLKVQVSFGVDDDVSDSSVKSDSATVYIRNKSTTPVAIKASTSKGDVSINGYVQAVWGAYDSWIVLFTSGYESSSASGSMQRSGFVNVYQCLASGISTDVNGIIVGVSIPSE